MIPEILPTIGVIGLGLIGGSLAKALLENEFIVYGIDNDINTQNIARSDGILITESIEALVNQSDLVFIATPQEELFKVGDTIANYCNKEITVSDVGSVKRPFHKMASQHADKSNIQWIGGHPLAGTEHSGYSNANSRLFAGAVWAVSLENATDINTYLSLSKILLRLGVRILPISPEVHDDSVARISHLPYILSALVAIIAGESKNRNLTLNLAAGSFRDLTRVAGSRPSFSASLSLSNFDIVSDLLGEATQDLQNIRNVILDKQYAELLAYYSKGKAIREAMLYKEVARLSRTIEMQNSSKAISELISIGLSGALIVNQKIVDDKAIELGLEATLSSELPSNDPE